MFNFSSKLKQKRFDALVSGYHKDLYRYAYWRCGNKELAEDIVQETYLRAWKSLDQLNENKAAKGWLYTILRNEHLRYLNKPHNRAEMVEFEDEIASNKTPEREMQQTQLRHDIMALPLEYREPMYLQIVGGFSISEIAVLIEKKLAHTNTLLYRGRKQLAERYAQDAKIMVNQNG